MSPINLECTDCSEGIALWIDRQTKDEYKYLEHSRSPRDSETCLVNELKFDKADTKEKPHGRQVFLDKSKRYWYVDNLHKGGSAHLEVFDRNGIHLGEANLEGEIDAAKRDKNKTLDV